MTVEAPETNTGDGTLYAKATKIYPQSVKGRYRNFKWAFMAVSLGIYYFLPFVRWTAVRVPRIRLS